MLPLLLLAAMQSPPPPSKVILVTIRGVEERHVDAYLRAGVLAADGGFARLRKQGLRVKELIPVPGAVTATAAATLATGATPGRHGITGNTLHQLGEPLEKATSGFTIPLDAETLREAAARQGKRVVDILPVLASNSRDGNRSAHVLTGGNSENGPRNTGTPPEFVSAITAAVGHWPGYPDHAGLMEGRITGSQLVEQSDRLRAFKTAAAKHVLKQGNFDLLIVDDPTVDAIMHGFPDPASPEAKRSYQLADQTLRELMDAAGTGVTLVAASGHGIQPMLRGIGMGKLLAGSGARAFAYGPVAHIRTNRPERIARFLKAAQDPQGRRIFEHIQILGPSDHPRNSGDVMVVARPGYFLHYGEGDTFRFPGDHGFLSDRGALYAAGPGIRPRTLGSARLIDVAATVSALLGIQPPAQSEGRNLLR